MTSTLDRTVDAAADRLASFVESARRDGGARAKLAEALEGDADFVRKLKPSLVAARARGAAPTDESPGATRRAPSAPQFERPRPQADTTTTKRSGGGGGPSPWLVVGAALFLGILAAKALDWRGHAHPR